MEIDFLTAFGRLLRDGNLRDAFAVNPQAAARQVQLRPADLPFWLQLVPADVEFQATVLLRKRLELVKHFAPETCLRLGETLWATFQRYGRVHWPPEGTAKTFDAFEFCRQLKEQGQNGRVVAISEWNRLDFALSKRRLAVHWIELPMVKRKRRRGFQLFLRGTGQRWWELFFYLSL